MKYPAMNRILQHAKAAAIEARPPEPLALTEEEAKALLEELGKIWEPWDRFGSDLEVLVGYQTEKPKYLEDLKDPEDIHGAMVYGVTLERGW